MLLNIIPLLLVFSGLATAQNTAPVTATISRYAKLINAVKDTLPPVMTIPGDIQAVSYLSLSNVLEASQSTPYPSVLPLSRIPIELTLTVLKVLRYEILSTPKTIAKINSILVKNNLPSNSYNVSLLEAYGLPEGLRAYHIHDVEYIRATYLIYTNTIPIANISFETQNTTAFIQFQPPRIKAYSFSGDSDVEMPDVVELQDIKFDFDKAWGVARSVGELDEFESVKLVQGGGGGPGWKQQGYYLFRSEGILTRIGADDLCADEECASREGSTKGRRNRMGDRGGC